MLYVSLLGEQALTEDGTGIEARSSRDLRVFDIARPAALTAAAADDDAGVLVHAATAVECCQGDLLPGRYDDWLLDARSERERQCAELCDLLAATRARTGDLAGAVQAARRRIKLQPLEEAGYRTLMLLQADLGDRAGAVSTYHHCASVLERELGVIPDPATRQVFQKLMADGAPSGVSVAVQTGRSGFAAAQLIGRSREFGLLRNRWQAAAGGVPGFVLVRGGAGVGKSRIAAELAAVARLEGAVVTSSQCFGASGRLALTMRRPLSRGCVRPRGWRTTRAASRCSGAASATSPDAALIRCRRAFPRFPEANASPRTLRERCGS